MRRIIILIAVVALAWYLLFVRTYPETYSDTVDHFKFGSIGSEPVNGLPYWMWKALPVIFSEELDGEGYEAFGFLYEPDRDLPIGVSRRKVQGIDRVWLNCSVCHTGTYRESPEAEPVRIVGAPANNLKLYEFIQFLRDVPLDNNRFNADSVLAAIEEAGGDLNFIERLLYRYIVVDEVRDGFLTLRRQLAFMDRQQDWGPGRVDTFNPYKSIQFDFPMDRRSLPDRQLNGASDYPSLWKQGPREGMHLHWDGNNSSVEERNLSAALGAGVTPVTVDRDSIKRIEKWMWEFPPPAYPRTDSIDRAEADRGAALYASYCADCHGDKRDGAYDYDREAYPRLGRVEPLDEIGTDPGRWASYTQAFAGAQNMLYAGYPWRFTHFRKTEGYANHPLDGIWARSPYLHNGSVPTLRDLLEPAAERPTVFYRGYDVMDWEKVGYVSDVAEEDGERFFRYDTRLPGNSNSGHEGPAYGTQLSASEKDAIVEYMKTF